MDLSEDDREEAEEESDYAGEDEIGPVVESDSDEDEDEDEADNDDDIN